MPTQLNLKPAPCTSRQADEGLWTLQEHVANNKWMVEKQRILDERPIEFYRSWTRGENYQWFIQTHA